MILTKLLPSRYHEFARFHMRRLQHREVTAAHIHFLHDCSMEGMGGGASQVCVVFTHQSALRAVAPRAGRSLEGAGTAGYSGCRAVGWLLSTSTPPPWAVTSLCAWWGALMKW